MTPRASEKFGNGLRALGGGSLIGDRLMQLVYLDESGTGKIKHDPYAVFAGVIVNADKQAVALQKHLLGMVLHHVPEEHQKGFRFHARELVSGCDAFPRHNTLNQRMDILEELCSLPKLFDLPVVAGSCSRQMVIDACPEAGPLECLITALASAACVCVSHVEQFMRARDDQMELSSLYFEDNQMARNVIRSLLRRMMDSDNPISAPEMNGFFPIHRIMGEVSFQEKRDSSILQVADACAWAIRKKLSCGSHCDRYFFPIASQMLRSSYQSLELEKVSP